MSNSEESTRRIEAKLKLSETIADSELVSYHAVPAPEKNSQEDAVEPNAESGLPHFDEVSVRGVLQGGDAGESATGDVNRYKLGTLLGSGGGGRVFNLFDSNLKRTVAVKVLASNKKKDGIRIEKLLHEASIISQLDHPNILPIYDLASENGEVYYTMKRVEGMPLSAMIDNSEESTLIHVENNVDELVSTIVKVGDAVSYAHSLDIIHRDIKPANIMLGAYGEVRIVDWGTAADLKDGNKKETSVFGTPLYMSPEQARREPVQKQSDIYCLGASMFHVLFKRSPLWRDKVDDFWEAKKKGLLDELNPEEMEGVPLPLVAICLKCLEADPARRYQHMEEFIQDLKNYQSGTAVRVYEYSAVELFMQWYRRNKQTCAWLVLFTVMAALFTAYISVMHQREISGWGEPVVIETFDNAHDWKKNWHAYDGTYVVRDGRLVTDVGPSFFLFYNQRIQGSIAIEYEGEMLAGSPPCDLSVVYQNDIHPDELGQRELLRYKLQNGAYANTCSMIIGSGGERLDYNSNILENKKVYTVRAEIDEDQLLLFLDGQLICSHVMDFSLTSGYIGIYGYYYGKAFDNIKIYNKRLPEVTSIMKTGDNLYENGLVKQASDQYGKIAASHVGTTIAEEGLYKQALCMYKMGDLEQAFAVWDTLGHSAYETKIRIFRWQEMAKEKKYEPILQQMELVYLRSSELEREKIQEKWSSVLNMLVDQRRYELVRPFLRFRSKFFPDDQVYGTGVMEALSSIGAAEEALALFPGQDMVCAQALAHLGRHEEIIESYPNLRNNVAGALMDMARYNEVLADYADISFYRFEAMVNLGLLDDAQEIFGNKNRVHFRSNIWRLAKLHMYRGEYETVIENKLFSDWDRVQARVYAGDYAHALVSPAGGDGRISNNLWYDAATTIVLQKYITEVPEIDALNFPACTDGTARSRGHIFTVYLLESVLRHYTGDEQPLKNVLEEIWNEKRGVMGLRMWYCAGLLLGEIDEEKFLAQETRIRVQSDYNFYAGLREDLFGNPVLAMQHYENFKTMPTYEKERSLVRDIFIKWRIDTLKP